MGSVAQEEEAREQLVFSNTVESLFIRGLAGRLSVGALARLKAAGLDLQKPLLPGYTAPVFVSAVAIAASEVYPGVAPEEAYRQLGERTVLGMDETLLGRATMTLSKVIGPMRALLLMPKSMRGGSTYTRAVVRELGPKQMECDVTGYSLPYGQFQLGAMGGVLLVLGITSGKGEILQFAPERLFLSVRMTW